MSVKQIVFTGLLPLWFVTKSSELAIRASLEGDPTMVYRAICHDPLTAAVLSLAEIRQMTNELFAQHQAYLPQFKIHQV